MGKGISPISSKNSVPPLANSNFPAFPPSLAPVKAPSSYPNSSLLLNYLEWQHSLLLYKVYLSVGCFHKLILLLLPSLPLALPKQYCGLSVGYCYGLIYHSYKIWTISYYIHVFYGFMGSHLITIFFCYILYSFYFFS